MEARPEIALIEILELGSGNLTLQRAPKDFVMLVIQAANNKMVHQTKNATLSMALNQWLNNILVSRILNFILCRKQLHCTKSL